MLQIRQYYLLNFKYVAEVSSHAGRRHFDVGVKNQADRFGSNSVIAVSAVLHADKRVGFANQFSFAV